MKQELRKQMREMRKALSPVSYARKSRAICEEIENLDLFKEADDVLFYVSNDEEVSTHDFIQEQLKQGRNVYLPRVEGDQLVICRIQEWEDLDTGFLSILEPNQDCAVCHPSLIDVVLVPGIAFDKRGYRVGYGRGHYDRLLSTLPEAQKIGLAFEEQLVEHIEQEIHDIPVDLIVTDTQIIHP